MDFQNLMKIKFCSGPTQIRARLDTKKNRQTSKLCIYSGWRLYQYNEDDLRFNLIYIKQLNSIDQIRSQEKLSN